MLPQHQLLLASARRHRQAQEHLHAFAELIRAVAAQPLTAQLARDVVVYGRSAGTSVAAAAALEDSLEGSQGPARELVLRLLARTLRRLGRLSKARTHLYQSLECNPHDVGVQLELARVLFVEGRHRELAELLRTQSIAREPRHALGFRASLIRGHLLLQELGDPVGASQAFATAAIFPGLPPLQSALGRALACVAMVSSPMEPSGLGAKLRAAATAAIAKVGRDWPSPPPTNPEAFLAWFPRWLKPSGHRTELWVVREVLVRLQGKDEGTASLVGIF